MVKKADILKLKVEAWKIKHQINQNEQKNALPKDIRAVYTRENKPRLTLAAAYVSREHPE